MAKLSETGTCALCKGPYTRYGNNPQPALPDVGQRVCDDCNRMVVIPARMGGLDPYTKEALNELLRKDRKPRLVKG